MKKLILSVILAVVLITLTAASPKPEPPKPGKAIRMEITNKSGENLYIWLDEGEFDGQYYYMHIDAGTKSDPVVTVWTIFTDNYKVTATGEGYEPACLGLPTQNAKIGQQKNSAQTNPKN